MINVVCPESLEGTEPKLALVEANTQEQLTLDGLAQQIHRSQPDWAIAYGPIRNDGAYRQRVEERLDVIGDPSQAVVTRLDAAGSLLFYFGRSDVLGVSQNLATQHVNSRVEGQPAQHTDLGAWTKYLVGKSLTTPLDDTDKDGFLNVVLVNGLNTGFDSAIRVIQQAYAEINLIFLDHLSDFEPERSRSELAIHLTSDDILKRVATLYGKSVGEVKALCDEYLATVSPAHRSKRARIQKQASHSTAQPKMF